MCNDPISRQAAISFIENVPYIKDHPNMGDLIKEWLEQIPGVQPVQKTGRWEHDGGHFANRWICSQCGYKFYFEKSEAKYCPNCGVKMKSEERCGMDELKITQCTGEGQGSCRRCLDNGKWNRIWMCFLYKVEGKEGCYCRECVEEIKKKGDIQ